MQVSFAIHICLFRHRYTSISPYVNVTFAIHIGLFCHVRRHTTTSCIVYVCREAFLFQNTAHIFPSITKMHFSFAIHIGLFCHSYRSLLPFTLVSFAIFSLPVYVCGEIFHFQDLRNIADIFSSISKMHFSSAIHVGLFCDTYRSLLPHFPCNIKDTFSHPARPITYFLAPYTHDSHERQDGHIGVSVATYIGPFCHTYRSLLPYI